MNEELNKKIRDRINAPPDPPLEAVRKFLSSYVSGRDSMTEIEADIIRMAQINTRTLRAGLKGLEKLVAQPTLEKGELYKLISIEAGWVLPEDNDEKTSAS